MSTRESLIDLLKILLKWRSLIIIVTVLAIVGSVVISLLMPNQFKSQASFKPYNLVKFDRIFMFSKSMEKPISFFGDKSDIARMLSLANSQQMTDHIINEFNLAVHYRIDTSSRDWRYKAQRKFQGNYKALRTERENLQLTVFDTDPQLAASIANYIMYKIDQSNITLIQDHNKDVLKTVSTQLDNMQSDLIKTTDSLANIRDTGSVYYKLLSKQQEILVDEMSELKSLKDQYEAASSHKFSSIFIIQEAQPAIKKSKPVRWIIVVASTLAAFFISMLGSIFIEKYKELRHELNNAA